MLYKINRNVTVTFIIGSIKNGKPVNVLSISVIFEVAPRMKCILCEVCIWLHWELLMQHCLLH